MYTKLPIHITFDGEELLSPETEMELNDEHLLSVPLSFSTSAEEVINSDAPMLINYGNTSGELTFRTRHKYAPGELYTAYSDFVGILRTWRTKGCGTLTIDGMSWEASVTTCTPSLGFVQKFPALFVEYSFLLGRLS